MNEQNIPLGLTFDDVLLKPRYSEIKSRKEVNLKTSLTKKIKLSIPIISASMDTVTESEMAIVMARLGGLGIIHRFISPQAQASEVAKVKRSETFIIENPITLPLNSSLSKAKTVSEENNISGILVVGNNNRNKNKKLLGIITKRDMAYQPHQDEKKPIKEFMTKKLITAKPGISVNKAKQILINNKIEKLPLVDEHNNLKGLITLSDIIKKEKFSFSSTDKKGKLLVGGAIGIKPEELTRAKLLIKSGVDILVVDVAHGHSSSVIQTIKKLKKNFPQLPIIAGNVATARGIKDLTEAGADAIKIGIGPGSICTTRLVAGVGVPQISAILNCFKQAKKTKTPLIADGGIRYPGDIAKAIAAGASSVMIGSLLAGTKESPGLVINKEGMNYKVSRGMASLGANIKKKKSSQEKTISQEDIEGVVPEGVEAIVPYKGKVKDVMFNLTGGLRSALSYLGANNLEELKAKAKFIRITSQGLKEGHPHDVNRL